MDNGLTLADIAAVTDSKNDGMMSGGAGGGMWIFALLILLLLGGGNGLFGAGKNGAVTEAGLCNAMNFNDLQNAVGRLSDQNQNQTMQISNGLCNLGYEQLSNISALGKEVALGQANLGQQISIGDANLAQQISNCCCTTQRGIDSINYNNAINTAAINKNIDDRFAALEKGQLEQTINAQNAKIAQLELQAQMAGVVRYPTTFSYNAGVSPFCSGMSGCYTAPTI